MKMSEPVGWKDLLFLLGTFAFSVLTLNLYVVQRAEAQVSALQSTVEANKQSADAGVNEVRKDLQALYNFMLTRERQPRLEAK